MSASLKESYIRIYLSNYTADPIVITKTHLFIMGGKIMAMEVIM